MAAEPHIENTEFRTLRWTVNDGIGMLMMDQPPSNVMTLRFFSEFRRWSEDLGRQPGLKAVVIYGNGRHFSSGADLDELLVNLDEQLMTVNYRSFARLEQLGIPVISAIRGVCLGSAFELALFSHFRICAEDAVLGLPESTFNLMPGIGGIQRAASLAGRPRAIELLLRGTTYGAGDAFAMNLVDAVAPRRDVLKMATDFAMALPEGFRESSRRACIVKYLQNNHASA
jgi:enoyl-CoA hydratase